MRKKLIVLVVVVAAALTLTATAFAASVFGTTYYGSNGSKAYGTTVYLEQLVNNSWQIKCQQTVDSNAFYAFFAGWGYSPCGLLEGVLTRTEGAKYLYPSGFVCRGWSSQWFWSSTASQTKDIYLGNC